jgi:hypothetical protein
MQRGRPGKKRERRTSVKTATLRTTAAREPAHEPLANGPLDDDCAVMHGPPSVLREVLRMPPIKLRWEDDIDHALVGAVAQLLQRTTQANRIARYDQQLGKVAGECDRDIDSARTVDDALRHARNAGRAWVPVCIDGITAVYGLKRDMNTLVLD